MSSTNNINGSDVHILDIIADLIREDGPMQPEEIASKLASANKAIAVINPESVEQYERNDGETVNLIRGGTYRALSAAAIDKRLWKVHSGCKKRSDGSWELRD